MLELYTKIFLWIFDFIKDLWFGVLVFYLLYKVSCQFYYQPYFQDLLEKKIYQEIAIVLTVYGSLITIFLFILNYLVGYNERKRKLNIDMLQNNLNFGAILSLGSINYNPQLKNQSFWLVGSDKISDTENKTRKIAKRITRVHEILRDKTSCNERNPLFIIRNIGRGRALSVKISIFGKNQTTKTKIKLSEVFEPLTLHDNLSVNQDYTFRFNSSFTPYIDFVTKDIAAFD